MWRLLGVLTDPEVLEFDAVHISIRFTVGERGTRLCIYAMFGTEVLRHQEWPRLIDTQRQELTLK